MSVEAHRDGVRESPLCTHLLQGISRGDRMDWVVQKATELGVARITPVLTEFSVVRLDEDRADLEWVTLHHVFCFVSYKMGDFQQYLDGEAQKGAFDELER